jgi:hypothetical protein
MQYSRAARQPVPGLLRQKGEQVQQKSKTEDFPDED